MQDVVYALVELVQDPGAGILAGQQTHGAGDQVVEVEKAATRLELFVAADQPIGHGQGGARVLQHPQQREPVADLADRRAGRLVALRQIRQARDQRLAEYPRRAVGLAAALRKAFGKQCQPPFRIGLGEGAAGGGKHLIQHPAGADLSAHMPRRR